MAGHFHKTPKMVEEEMGESFVDICKKLKSEGLSPTEIAIKLQLKSSKYISQALYLDKLKNETELLFPEIKKPNLKLLEIEIPKLTGMTFKNFLYQKYIIEGMSTYLLSAKLGLNNGTLHNQLQRYGINKNMSQASIDSIESGRKNYTEIISKSRKTRSKTAGSFSQDVAIQSIKYEIVQHLTDYEQTKLEFIVGYNEYGILLDKEVDIPIIVIDNQKNKFYKFAIEYNGEYFHRTKRNNDKLKQKTLSTNQWILYYIEHPNNVDYLNIEKQVKDIIGDIFQYISSEKA